MSRRFPVMCVRVVLVIAFLILAALSAQAAGIVWEESFDAALERAKVENAPVFIAVNMDGEKVCEELCERHYRDARIVKLSGNMVCLFASTYDHRGGARACPRAGNITCAAHKQVEIDMRREVLKIPAGQPVIAPSHVFLAPDGSILLSVQYMLTTGQLEWCMAEAIRRVDPSFSWHLSASARAPRRVVFGDPSRREEGEEGGREAGPMPPSAEELEEMLDTLKRSGRGDRWQAVRDYFPRLILSDDKDAVAAVKSILSTQGMGGRGGRGGGGGGGGGGPGGEGGPGGGWSPGGQTARLLHQIGRSAVSCYWEVAADFTDHSDPSIRNEAIVALEQLAEPKSLKVLMKQRSTEKEDSARANLIRAIAATGTGNRGAGSLLLKTAEKDKQDFMRIHALIGLVHVENRDKVNPVLASALEHDNPGVRAAAAYAIGLRRETELADALKAALNAEQDLKCKTYLGAAAAALEGAGLRLLGGVLREYALDEIPRDRE